MIFIYIIAILIAIPLIGAALLSKQFTIEETININKPKQDVFNYLKLLRHSENFNKWVMTDPNLKKNFSGTDGTIGFVYSWESEMKNVGQGEQEIIGIAEGERIDYQIRFIKPFEGVSTSSLFTSSLTDQQTKVSWTFSGDRNYFMCIFHFLFNLKKMLGKDLQTSLVNLKNVLER